MTASVFDQVNDLMCMIEERRARPGGVIMGEVQVVALAEEVARYTDDSPEFVAYGIRRYGGQVFGVPILCVDQPDRLLVVSDDLTVRCGSGVDWNDDARRQAALAMLRRMRHDYASV